MEMFEKATRIKLRFETGSKGVITAEDLWDIPLTTTQGNQLSLDNLARYLARQLKDSEIGSFVVKTTKTDEILKLKFDIVKYIIDVKMAEAEEATKAREKAQQKRRLLEILGRKKDAELEGKSSEDIEKMINELTV